MHQLLVQLLLVLFWHRSIKVEKSTTVLYVA